MKILCIAQVEDSEYIESQLMQQTVQPDEIKIFVDPEPAQGIDARRERIAYNHRTRLRYMVEESDCDLVWQVEGDSQLPEHALELLLEDYKQLKNTTNLGYVSGIQVGRHGLYAIGAWKFNRQRSEFWSINYRAKELQEVDATGFYCLLAPKEAWLAGEASWDGERYGPDVNWGLSMKDKGYDIYVDMDLHIGHKAKKGVILPSHISTCNVHFFQKNGEWKYRVSD